MANRSSEVQLADKRGMEEASRLYRPPLLDIKEIRRKQKKQGRGRVK